MVDTFYTGQFTALGPFAEWDGTNQADIVDWLNNDFTHGTYSWGVQSVTGSELVLEFELGGSVARSYTVPINTWVGPSGSGTTSYYLNVAGPYLGHWRTADPFGRPDQASDIEAP